MSDLEKAYLERFENVLVPLAEAIEDHLIEQLGSEPRIDRVSARAKSVDRFLKKAKAQQDGKPKYSDPLRQIQDQLGARVVTFYVHDVDRIGDIVTKYYKAIETRDLIPDSVWEFGYFGRHYILHVPSDLNGGRFDKAKMPEFFELQIKTLFQHAWSEANHDLGYKPLCSPLDSEANRRLAFTSAQAWGADHIFGELFQTYGEGRKKANATQS